MISWIPLSRVLICFFFPLTWRVEIAASKGDSSKLWRTFKGVLGDAPPADSDVHTADDFAIRTSTTRSTPFKHLLLHATPLYDVPHRTTPTMTQWRDVTSDEVGIEADQRSTEQIVSV